jgi:inner membrane protein
MQAGPFPYALLITAAFSMLPDIDAVLGIVMRDFRRFHNNATHSLLTGLLAAAVLGLWLRRRGNPNARLWFVLAWVSYALHVLMDSATPGRGVMALWPLSTNRYNFPIPLFYGVQWSNGFISIDHLVTLATELLFVGLVALLLHFTGVIKRTK